MCEKGQSGKLLGVLSENLQKEGLLNSQTNREQDLSLDYKFVCGTRVVRLCRRISDYSQEECFSALGAGFFKLSVKRELTTIGFAVSGREAIKLTISFFASLSAQADLQQSALVLRIEDTLFTEQQPLEDPDSYIFSHNTLEGFLFRKNGLYLQFNRQDGIPASQSPDSKQVTTSEQSGFFYLQNSLLSFRFSFEHSNQGFSAKGELSCSNRKSDIAQSMGYNVEVLNKTSKSTKSSPLKESVASIQPQRSQLNKQKRNVKKQESEYEDAWIENYSQTEEIPSEENKQLNTQEEEEQLHYSRYQSSIEDTCYSSKVTECSCSKQQQSFSQVTESPVISEQPKKNVVKNFVKAFRSFVNSSDDQVKAALGGCSEAQLQEFRSAYHRFEASKNFNNTFIKYLILNEPFKPVFANFIKNHAWIWLQSSQVNNKEAHKEVLQDYLKAVVDTENIDQVYSLRTRKRQHLRIK